MHLNPEADACPDFPDQRARKRVIGRVAAVGAAVAVTAVVALSLARR